MAICSSLLWLIGFILSVVIAPQLRIWAWGPTMLFFAMATICALPVLWKKKSGLDSSYVILLGVVLILYLLIRSYFSTVTEYGLQDSLLVGMAVSTFLVFEVIAVERRSEYVWIVGIVALLAATLYVIFCQIVEPGFTPVFPRPETPAITGFHAHYSYCASFLVPISLIVAAIAMLGRMHWLYRIVLFFISFAGAAAVYYTKSRGGVIALGCGAGVLALGVLITGKRDNRSWYAPMAIVTPIALIGGAVMLLFLLENVEQVRGGSDLTQMLDNNIRFYMLGIAFSCIIEHPWFGGGSGSYSWESIKFWDNQAHGSHGALPNHVHNEFVQTISEYGLIGAALLSSFIILITIRCLVQSFLHNKESSHRFSDGLRIGGCSGLFALIVHSNFEGILRIPPGIVTLALCVAAASFSVGLPRRNNILSKSNKPILIVCSILVSIPMFIFGWKGTKVTQILWPVFYGDTAMNYEQKENAYSAAILIWPLMSIYENRAFLYHAAASSVIDDNKRKELVKLAVMDYNYLNVLHPYNPMYKFNLADLTSYEQKYVAAHALYKQGILGMGDMEAVFFGHYRYADSLCNRAVKENKNGNLNLALSIIENAITEVDKTLNMHNPSGERGYDLFIQIHATKALILENMGDYEGAVKEYENICSRWYGASGHFLLASFYSTRAEACLLSNRPEDALRLFNESEHRMSLSTALPKGHSVESKAVIQQYIRSNIDSLNESGVKPSPKIQF